MHFRTPAVPSIPGTIGSITGITLPRTRGCPPSEASGGRSPAETRLPGNGPPQPAKRVTVTNTAVFDETLIRRYDPPGPRYTSYPTALQFSPDFGADQFFAAARASNAGSLPKPLSVYVHVSFCANPCFYCGCNKVITHGPRQGEHYLARLGQEIELVGAAFRRRRTVSHLHLAGAHQRSSQSNCLPN